MQVKLLFADYNYRYKQRQADHLLLLLAMGRPFVRWNWLQSMDMNVSNVNNSAPLLVDSLLKTNAPFFVVRYLRNYLLFCLFIFLLLHLSKRKWKLDQRCFSPDCLICLFTQPSSLSCHPKITFADLNRTSILTCPWRIPRVHRNLHCLLNAIRLCDWMHRNVS